MKHARQTKTSLEVQLEKCNEILMEENELLRMEVEEYKERFEELKVYLTTLGNTVEEVHKKICNGDDFDSQDSGSINQ